MFEEEYQEFESVNTSDWRNEEGAVDYNTILDDTNTNSLPSNEHLGRRRSEKEQALQEWRNSRAFEEGLKAILAEAEPHKPPLPTNEELSARFGASFQQFIDRFKGDIEFYITDVVTRLNVPVDLETIIWDLSSLSNSAVPAVNILLEDTEANPIKKVDLEMMRVDIHITNKTADEIERNNPSRAFIGDTKITAEKRYYFIDENRCRDIDEDGVTVNPGVGDEWIKVNVYDEINDRALEIMFKFYLQIPMQ